jgi:hypothetical protein
MATFTIEIELYNAAFAGSPVDRDTEIARILRGVAEQVEEDGSHPGSREPVWDINGNPCGYWVVRV